MANSDNNLCYHIVTELHNLLSIVSKSVTYSNRIYYQDYILNTKNDQEISNRICY